MNWVLQVEKKGLGPYVVGALDGGAVELCEARGFPAVSFGNLTMPTTGAYWRTEEGTFLRMATLKTELLRGLLLSDWDIMMSDVDVVWFESPWRWIGPKGANVSVYPEAAKMAKADLLVSTDIVEVETDSIWASWLLNREYNTGIIFWRATERSLLLVKLWRERLEIEGAIPGLYINDQAVFNRMSHGQWNGPPVPLELTPEEHPDLNPDAVRGVYWVTSPVMADSKVAPMLRVAMGTLPQQRFCNGHVFFINRLPSRFGLRPIAVHATYQFADEKTYSFGKRHRLRQAQGWNIDTPEYYAEGRFLTISGDSLLAGQPYRRDQLATFKGRTSRHHMYDNGLALHFSMEKIQREMLYDAFALAIALNRTLVLPLMTCFCDRYWWLVHACRMPGAESMPLPIQCPLDHLYDIGRWYDAKLDFREAGFLTNPRVPRALAASRARLRLQRSGGGGAGARAPEFDDGQPVTEEVALREGLTYEGAAAAVEASAGGGARVLEVDPRDLSGFCGFLDKTRSRTVDSRLTMAFSMHVNLCGEEDNILCAPPYCFVLAFFSLPSAGPR